jgi:hypothetical protein
MRVRIITDDCTSALEAGGETAVLIRLDKSVSEAVMSLDTDARESYAPTDADPVAATALAWRDADVLVLLPSDS